VKGVLTAFGWRDAVDIAVVAVIVYLLLTVVRGTRAIQMLLGVAVLVLASLAARALDLHSLGWLLDSLWSFWVVVLVVLFQPELRRALAWVGQGEGLRSLLAGGSGATRVVDEVTSVTGSLADRRIGALIVLERGTGLRQYAELGVALDALVSADLLISVFLPYSPLHDGAVFIRGGRVVAAGCFLPLSRNPQLGRTLGTRHRAALGITEETDAIAVVASEETGRLSLAVAGRIEIAPDADALRQRLEELMGVGTVTAREGIGLGALRRLWGRQTMAPGAEGPGGSSRG
jgi:diadenylate cyclase